MKSYIQDFLNDKKMSKEEKVSKLYNYFVDGIITKKTDGTLITAKLVFKEEDNYILFDISKIGYTYILEDVDDEIFFDYKGDWDEYKTYGENCFKITEEELETLILFINVFDLQTLKDIQYISKKGESNNE